MDKNISGRKIDEQLLINDPVISFWLKDQIRITKSRDVLDTLIDAEMLIKILNQRWDAEKARASGYLNHQCIATELKDN